MRDKRRRPTRMGLSTPCSKARKSPRSHSTKSASSRIPVMLVQSEIQAQGTTRTWHHQRDKRRGFQVTKQKFEWRTRMRILKNSRKSRVLKSKVTLKSLPLEDRSMLSYSRWISTDQWHQLLIHHRCVSREKTQWLPMSSTSRWTNPSLTRRIIQMPICNFSIHRNRMKMVSFPRPISRPESSPLTWKKTLVVNSAAPDLIRSTLARSMMRTCSYVSLAASSKPSPLEESLLCSCRRRPRTREAGWTSVVHPDRPSWTICEHFVNSHNSHLRQGRL